LADIAANAQRGRNAAAISPVALEAVRRIDILFDIERTINGLSAEERLRVRREISAPHLSTLEAWLRDQRSRLSRSASVAEPIDYMLKRWGRFAQFIDDGRICLTNKRPNARCADLPRDVNRGCSLALIAARPGRRNDDADRDSQAQRR
jgi:transposase